MFIEYLKNKIYITIKFLKSLFINTLKEKYKDEQVLVVDDNDLVLAMLNGLSIEYYLYSYGEFQLRYKMENNKKYRQIIPYCVLLYKDYVFLTKRVNGDNRLVGKYSIGIGGHINPIDDMDEDILNKAIKREIDEEVNLNSNIVSTELVDVIYLSTTEVDSVHLGLVYFITLDGTDVTIKETDTLEGCFVHINEIDESKLENWSKVVYKNFLESDGN